MNRRVLLATAVLAIVEVDRRLTAARRHSELLAAVDSLDRISGFVPSFEEPKPVVPSSPPPIIGVLLGPSNGRVAIVHDDGSRVMRSTPIEVFEAVAEVAGRAGVDIDEVEQALLASKKGVTEVRYLPQKTIQNGSRRLVELVMRSPFDGGAW
jgi:hypothetical protein